MNVTQSFNLEEIARAVRYGSAYLCLCRLGADAHERDQTIFPSIEGILRPPTPAKPGGQLTKREAIAPLRTLQIAITGVCGEVRRALPSAGLLIDKVHATIWPRIGHVVEGFQFLQLDHPIAAVYDAAAALAMCELFCVQDAACAAERRKLITRPFEEPNSTSLRDIQIALLDALAAADPLKTLDNASWGNEALKWVLKEAAERLRQFHRLAAGR